MAGHHGLCRRLCHLGFDLSGDPAGRRDHSRFRWRVRGQLRRAPSFMHGHDGAVRRNQNSPIGWAQPSSADFYCSAETDFSVGRNSESIRRFGADYRLRAIVDDPAGMALAPRATANPRHHLRADRGICWTRFPRRYRADGATGRSSICPMPWYSSWQHFCGPQARCIRGARDCPHPSCRLPPWKCSQAGRY